MLASALVAQETPTSSSPNSIDALVSMALANNAELKSFEAEVAVAMGREFRQRAVFWVERGRIEVVSCENGERKFVGLWEERFRLWSDKPGYRIYVIRLESEVRKAKRFRVANPLAREDAECLYVGMTICSAEERFAQHKRGYKACAFVRKHGLSLAPDLFPGNDLLPLEAAKKLEVDHAEYLRGQGYAVWQK